MFFSVCVADDVNKVLLKSVDEGNICAIHSNIYDFVLTNAVTLYIFCDFPEYLESSWCQLRHLLVTLQVFLMTICGDANNDDKYGVVIGFSG